MAKDDLVVKVGYDDADLVAGIRNTEAMIRRQNAQMKSTASAWLTAGEYVKGYQAQVKGLAGTLEKRLQIEKQAKQAVKDITDAGVSGYKSQEEYVKKLTYAEEKLENATAKAAAEQAKFARAKNALSLAQNGVQELRHDYSLLESTVASNVKMWEVQGRTLSAQRAQYIGNKEQIGQLTKMLSAEQAALRVTASSLGVTSDEYRTQSAAISELTGKLKVMQAQQNGFAGLGGLNAQFANMGSGLTKFTDLTRNAGNWISTLGSNMRSSAMNGILWAGVVGTAMVDGVKKTSALQQTLRETYNMIDNKGGLTANDFISEYSDKIADVSVKWGVAQQDIANGMQEVFRAGYDYQSSFGMVSVALKTAMATGENYNDILENTTKIMSQFGMKTDDVDKNIANSNLVSNILAKVANDTQTSFTNLSLGMSRIGPIASDLGYDVAQTATYLGIMSNRGIDAQQAGNNLRMVLQRLTAPTEAAADELKNMGVALTDKNGDLRELPDIMKDIDEGTKNLGSAKRSQVMKTIFGAYASTAATALKAAADDINKEEKAVDNAGTDYITKLAKENMKGPEAQLAILKQQYEKFKMDFAKDMMPALMQVMKIGTEFMNWYDKLDDGTKKFAATMTLIAMASVPLKLVLGSFFGIIGGGLKGISSMILLGAKLTTVMKNLGLVTKGAYAAMQTGSGLSMALGAGIDATQAKSAGKVGTSVVSEVAEESAEAVMTRQMTKQVAAQTAAKNAIAGTGKEVLSTGLMFARVIPWVAGVTVALGAGALAWNLYQKHVKEAKAEAAKKERVTAYGFDASKSEREELDKVMVAAQQANVEIDRIGNHKLSTADVEALKKAYNDLGDAVADAADGKMSDLGDIIASDATPEGLKKKLQAYLDGVGKIEDQSKKWQEEANKIVDSASGKRLTEGQKKRLDELNRNMAKALIDVGDLSTKEKELAKKAMDGAFDGLSNGQLKRAGESYAKAMSDNVSAAVDATQAAIKSGAVKADEAWAEFFKSNGSVVKPLADTFNAEIGKIDWSKGIDKGMGAYTTAWKNLEQYAKDAGIPVEQLAKQYGLLTPEVEKAYQSLDKYNLLKPEEKTAIIKTLGKDQLIEIINDTAKWNTLSPEAKYAIIKSTGSAGVNALMGQLKEWNSLNPKQKRAVATAAGRGDVSALLQIVSAYGLLNNPKTKKAVANAIGKGDINGLIGIINTFAGTPTGKAKIAKAVAQGAPSLSTLNHNIQTFYGLSTGDAKNAVVKSNNYGNYNIDTLLGKALAFQNLQDKTVTLTTNTVENRDTYWQTHAGPLQTDNKAGGTSSLQNENVWLGDGGRSEAYVTPDGRMGVTPRNWTLYNLPRGTQVFPSLSAIAQYTQGMMSSKIFAKHAGGGNIGHIPLTPTMQAVQRVVEKPVRQAVTTPVVRTQVVDNSDVVSQLQTLIQAQSGIIQALYDTALTSRDIYNANRKEATSQAQLNSFAKG